MSRVAKSRSCAAGCERTYLAKGQSGMYANCLSDCRRRSEPHHAAVSYIAAPKRRKATMSRGDYPQYVTSYDSLPERHAIVVIPASEPPRRQFYKLDNVEREETLLDAARDAVYNVANFTGLMAGRKNPTELKFRGRGRKVSKTKTTKTKKAANPKRTVRRTAVKKPKSKRRPVARWP